MENELIATIDDALSDDYMISALGLKPSYITAEMLRKEKSMLFKRYAIQRSDFKGYWFLDLRLWSILPDERSIWTVDFRTVGTDKFFGTPQIELSREQLHDEKLDWLYSVMDIGANQIDAARERGEL